MQRRPGVGVKSNLDVIEAAVDGGLAAATRPHIVAGTGEYLVLATVASDCGDPCSDGIRCFHGGLEEAIYEADELALPSQFPASSVPKWRLD